MAVFVGPQGTTYGSGQGPRTTWGRGFYQGMPNRGQESDRVFNYRAGGGAMGFLTGGWVGTRSSRLFSAAGGNIGRAISGRHPTYANATRPTIRTYKGSGKAYILKGKQYNTNVRVRGPGIMDSAARAAYLKKADKQIWKGIRKLPMKTKLGVPAAAIGAFAWMHRSKRDNFYTHYYDF